MENTKLLSDMGVCDGSTVYQVLKLRGGGEAKESNGYQMSLSKLPAIVDASSRELFASAPGGTALSGASDQRFTTVIASKYEAVTEVRLRLVCATDMASTQVAQPEMSLRKAMSNAYPPPLDQLSLSASDDPDPVSDTEDYEDNGAYEDSEFSSFDIL